MSGLVAAARPRPWATALACFPHTEIGATTLVYDPRLRVETGDAARPFYAVITFEAAPFSSAPDATG